ncbi:hypothetical protein EVAR_96339_1 [Eumeta japonica]|uniref:Uncharacterized protein n=1 Tax=Eumeta variegata TaxID=151549 RepID=A0A4C1VZ15_EUMVA|nr:hypothetical protein EVAR_96339_1 [Eumeta japonica]
MNNSTRACVNYACALLKNDSAKLFAQQLLNMGDGKLPVHPSTQEISFPQNFCQLQSSIEDLEDKVFPNIASNFKNHDWLCERAILALKNTINNRIQLKIPGTVTEYKSIDTTQDKEENLGIDELGGEESSSTPKVQNSYTESNALQASLDNSNPVINSKVVQKRRAKTRQSYKKSTSR